MTNHFAVKVGEILNEYLKNPVANNFHFEGYMTSDHDRQHVHDTIATD